MCDWKIVAVLMVLGRVFPAEWFTSFMENLVHFSKIFFSLTSVAGQLEQSKVIDDNCKQLKLGLGNRNQNIGKRIGLKFLKRFLKIILQLIFEDAFINCPKQ